MSRYEAIAERLRRNILDGTYGPRQQLPSQRELARQWSTTVVTVRQALDLLSQAGLVTVRHGVGTFVADLGSQHEILHLSSFAEELASRNLKLTTHLVSLEIRTHCETAAHALHLSRRASLVALTRLRVLGEVPILYQVSYLPSRYARAITGYEASTPLYAYLRDRIGLVATSYEEELLPTLVPADIAAWLAVPPHTQAILSCRVSFGADGKPFLYDEAYMPPDRITIKVRRTGSRFSVEYMPRLDTAQAGPSAIADG